MNSTEFLDIGRHCSNDSCRQLDFLPFSCPSCSLPFCASHWRPDGGHACASYDPALADNRIPSCPLCATPISFPPGTDPNAPMDAHLSSRCPVLHPQLAPPSTSTSSSSSSALAPRTTKPKAPNTCRAPRCRTKMLVPIRCDACRASFCPAHRFPSDHACAGAPARGAGAAAGSAQAQAQVQAAGASVKRALGGLLGSRSGSGSGSASTSGTKKTPPPTRASTSSSSSRLTPTTAAAAVPPPRPAPPPPSRAGLAALRRAQHAASAKAPAGAPVGTAANPLVLDSSDDEDGDGEVQVVEPGEGKGKGKGAAAGRKVTGAGGGAGRAAAGSGAGGGGGGGASAGASSAATKALARTGLRGAPSKRALQEQESARKALEVRARKGLLTEDEKVRYATMQALQASAQGKTKGKGSDEACLVS